MLGSSVQPDRGVVHDVLELGRQVRVVAQQVDPAQRDGQIVVDQVADLAPVKTTPWSRAASCGPAGSPRLLGLLHEQLVDQTASR